MIEPGDHGNSPRVFLAARTFSTPIAIAAVRCGILSAFARASIVLEGPVEDLIFAPRHFLFLPEQLLQILHPFEIADHHAAGIAEDVRNHEDLVLALLQDQIGLRRGRTVGALGQHAAFQLFRDLRIDHPLHRRRHQHVARQRQHLRGIEVQLVGEAGDAAVRARVAHQRRNIEPAWIVQRAGVVAHRDHLDAVLMQFQRRIGADIAKALDHRGRVPGSIESSFITRRAR